jgi:predicted metal-dependent peptidase
MSNDLILYGKKGNSIEVKEILTHVFRRNNELNDAGKRGTPIIQESYFSMFFSEIHNIWRQGAEIEIIECDAEVQRIYEYQGKKPSFLKGGGGTHFDPVFSYINENSFKRYDGCIYLTDGYAPQPQVKPPCKVFWLLTPDGSSDALDYCKEIFKNRT